jgi:hypothetical protein
MTLVESKLLGNKLFRFDHLDSLNMERDVCEKLLILKTKSIDANKSVQAFKRKLNGQKWLGQCPSHNIVCLSLRQVDEILQK